ncbi:hypothetical protein BpHYR1_021337, partial [Brachionus plicatilis]
MICIPNLEQLDQTQSSSSALTRNPIANHHQDTDNEVEEIVLPHEKQPERRRKIIYASLKNIQIRNLLWLLLNEDFLQDCSWAKLSKKKADDLTVQFYYCSSAEDDHSHPEPKTGISAETKEILRQLYYYEKVTRPDCIQKRLFDKKVTIIPKVSQIQTFLKVLKSETVQNITSLDELFAWCRDNERTPDDPNTTQASKSTQASTSTQYPHQRKLQHRLKHPHQHNQKRESEEDLQNKMLRKKSKKMSETLSNESVLEDPANQTLEDVDQDWTDVLKRANEIRKRGKARKNDEHTNHLNDEEDIRKIDPIIYQKIVEYENFGQKPEAIITNLIKAGLQPPKKTKINNFLKVIRKANKVRNQPTMNDLKEWCDQYNEIPEHDDQVFVAEYEYQAFPEQKFRVLLTTKRLIRNALDTKYILSDATYKLTYSGFPALTGGTTDKNLIKMNNNNWKNSTCTCVDWLKNNKCSHTIAVVYRLNLVNFNDVFMDLSISNKKKKGAPQKAKSLQHQPSDLVSDEELGIDDEVVPPSKRVCVRPTTSPMASEI